MRRGSSSLVAGVCLAVASTVAACGGGSSGTPSDPRGELRAGIGQLVDKDVLTTTLLLEAAPSDLQALAAADGQPITTGDAQALSSAQLVIETKTTDGSHLSDPGQANVSIRATSGGHSYVELRVVSGDLFLNADVRGFLTLIHKGRLYTEVTARTATLPKFVQAAVAGRWVTLGGGAVQSLAGQFGISAQQGTAAPTQRLVSGLQRVLSSDVTVRRVGTDSRGDHLVATGDPRRIAGDLTTLARQSLPGGSIALSRADVSGIPRKPVTLDAWVKDGVLTEISIDLGQFAKPGDPAKGRHLRVALTFQQSGDDIQKPTGAIPVDLSQLSTLFQAVG